MGLVLPVPLVARADEECSEAEEPEGECGSWKREAPCKALMSELLRLCTCAPIVEDDAFAAADMLRGNCSASGEPKSFVARESKMLLARPEIAAMERRASWDALGPLDPEDDVVRW